MSVAKNISVLILAMGLATGAVAQGNKGAGRPNRPGPHFGDWLRKNLNTPPDQKQKALQSDPTFQKLPPERQQRLMNRLQWFNSLPPERQQRLLKRMEAWEHMPPEQRKQARGLLDRMQAIPDDRRRAIWDQVRSFSVMTPDERQKAMNSDQYKKGFSDDEKNLMQQWLQLRDTADESAEPSLDDPPEH
jgi:hypothetical protein